MNFSESVGRINLILFALDSVNQAPSFDYNKSIIKETLNFNIKGGGLILAANVHGVAGHFGILILCILF